MHIQPGGVTSRLGSPVFSPSGNFLFKPTVADGNQKISSHKQVYCNT